MDSVSAEHEEDAALSSLLEGELLADETGALPFGRGDLLGGDQDDPLAGLDSELADEEALDANVDIPDSTLPVFDVGTDALLERRLGEGLADLEQLVGPLKVPGMGGGDMLTEPVFDLDAAALELKASGFSSMVQVTSAYALGTVRDDDTAQIDIISMPALTLLGQQEVLLGAATSLAGPVVEQQTPEVETAPMPMWGEMSSLPELVDMLNQNPLTGEQQLTAAEQQQQQGMGAGGGAALFPEIERPTLAKDQQQPFGGMPAMGMVSLPNFQSFGSFTSLVGGLEGWGGLGAPTRLEQGLAGGVAFGLDGLGLPPLPALDLDASGAQQPLGLPKLEPLVFEEGRGPSAYPAPPWRSACLES